MDKYRHAASALAGTVVAGSTDEDTILLSSDGDGADVLPDSSSGEPLVNVSADLNTGHNIGQALAKPLRQLAWSYLDSEVFGGWGSVVADTAFGAIAGLTRTGAGAEVDPGSYDPVMPSAGELEYRYCGNSPANAVDRRGLVDDAVPLSPRDRLKAALRKIVGNLQRTWTVEQRRQFNDGFKDGFVDGAKSTIQFIFSLRDHASNAAYSIFKGYVWAMTAVGDGLGSFLYQTPSVEYKQAANAGRRMIHGVAVTAANAAVIASDLYAMAQEIGVVIGTNIADKLFGGGAPPVPGTPSAADRVLEQASPLTIAVLNVVAGAVADLSPHDQGYILGIVVEQVLECVVVAAATEGAGAALESGALEGSIAEALEGTEAYASANSKRLQSVVKALREAKVSGRTAEDIANDLKAFLIRAHQDEEGAVYFLGVPIPSVRNGEFARWFNNLPPDELDKLWENRTLRDAVERRLRSPGGFHEWLPVSRAPKFKQWGVTAEEIRELRTATRDVRFTYPGVHGKDFSGTAHNQILKLVDESKDFESFKRALRIWAEENLIGGANALPPGLR